MRGKGRCHFQHLFTQFHQAPALPGMSLHQATHAVQRLVSIEAQQQVNLVARHDVLHR